MGAASDSGLTSMAAAANWMRRAEGDARSRVAMKSREAPPSKTGEMSWLRAENLLLVMGVLSASSVGAPSSLSADVGDGGEPGMVSWRLGVTWVERVVRPPRPRMVGVAFLCLLAGIVRQQ
jgi:hypothetical protein